MEFTGERVVPGAVEPDLWNEHISRYYFAGRFAAGKHALDVGCGAGYGTALLARTAGWVLGFDISLEAVAYAQAHYPGAAFVVGSAEAFPAPSGGFGLVTAFEVIEHVAAWAALISEAARVLAPDGVFLVSTPNKVYYAESRQEAGPNPFHVHEFDYAEFELSLRQAFPFVRILAQNQQQTIAFSGEHVGYGVSFTATPPDVSKSHFLLAACSRMPVDCEPFAYVESSGNLLGEREHHIRSLNSELAEVRQQFADLLSRHRGLQDQLEEQNAWAATLNRELESAREKLAHEQQNAVSLAASYENKLQELHAERAVMAASYQNRLEELHAERALIAASYENKLHELHAEAASMAASYENKLGELHAEVASMAASYETKLDELHGELGRRAMWANGLDADLALLRNRIATMEASSAEMQAKLDVVTRSRWHRLGAALGCAPQLERPSS